MPRSVRNTVLSTMKPTTRDRKYTKVLSTPWIRVSVTMSPLATWLISWPSTASTSSRLIDSSRPVETATSAEFLNAPVAKAFGAPSYTATSGMPMFALSARRRTVSTSQRSCAPSGAFMMCAPVDHSAICLEIRSDMNDPPKPITRESQSSVSRLRPFSVRNRSTPSALATTESSSTTARLVAIKRKMRFMVSVSASIRKLAARWGRHAGISRVRGWDQARDCIDKNKKAGSPAFLVLRGPWAGAALALGFGLLAFGLGLFLAVVGLRLGGGRLRGRGFLRRCRRCRGLRGCCRSGFLHLRGRVERRRGERCGDDYCDQVFHLVPR